MADLLYRVRNSAKECVSKIVFLSMGPKMSKMEQKMTNFGTLVVYCGMLRQKLRRRLDPPWPIYYKGCEIWPRKAFFRKKNIYIYIMYVYYIRLINKKIRFCIFK